MLSKLRYYSQPITPATTADMQEQQSAVLRFLQNRFDGSVLSPVEGGTLGVCFRLDAGARTHFIKTHQPDVTSRDNLRKEIEIMAALYGQQIGLEQFDAKLPSGDQSFMLMNWLTPSTRAVTPPDLLSIVADWQEALASAPHAAPARFATTAQIIEQGETSLSELEHRQHVSPDTAAAIRPYLARLRAAVRDIPPVVCHGDLSNKNIMVSSERTVVIDWEDAFLGFPGYDYLYWLTFMDNRKYLVPSSLGHTGLDEQSERGALLMIVAIKSLISVRANTIRPTHVPVETRLAELLAF